MSIFPVINLARLQSPTLGRHPGRQKKLEKLKSDLRTYVEQVDVSEPLIDHILNIFVEREIGLYSRVGDALKGVMLANAGGSALDHAVALYGVKRLIIEPANPDASPPTEAVLESDERLRLRARLSLESLSQAGCEGAYLFQALSASPHIKDVGIHVPDFIQTQANTRREVHVYILLDPEEFTDGKADTPDEDKNNKVIESVQQALNAVCSVTDRIVVRQANTHPYTVKADLTLEPGADEQRVKESAREAVTRLVAENYRLGKNIIRSEFLSAMYQTGVGQVELHEPAQDQAISIDTVALFSSPAEENLVIETKTREKNDKLSV